MTKIYVVRHGKTIFNATDRIQGVCDAPLIASGEEEISRVGQELAKRNWNVSMTYHSDLKRTRQTLEILRHEMGLSKLPMAEVDAVGEWNFGSFEGVDNGISIFLDLLPRAAGKSSLEDMTCEEIANTFHQIDSFGIAPTWNELRERILNGFWSIAEDCDRSGSDGLVVSHGMTMLALYYILTGKTLYPGSIKNGGVIELSYQDGILTVDGIELSVI